jgi:hypothetical protein
LRVTRMKFPRDPQPFVRRTSFPEFERSFY